MKKRLFIFTLALTQTLTLFSQPHKYIPFPDSNAIWVVKQLNEFGQEISGKNYFYPNKDTTISGKSYHIITSCLDSNFTPCEKPEVYLKSWYGLRNDTAARKVFMCSTFGTEFLLYDFSLTEGDTINGWWGGGQRYNGAAITNIDTFMLDTNEHLIYYVSNGYAPYIEGIGSVAGLFEKAYFFEGGYELVCLMTGEDRTPYFTYSSNTCELYHWTGVDDLVEVASNILIYPNPINELSVIELSDLADVIENLSIFDLTGKAVIEVQSFRQNIFPVGNEITRSGMYFCRIETRSGKFFNGKLIK